MNWSFILTSALYTAISVQSIGYILAAIGLNVHFGYTGLLNFGQAAFAAAGAFAIAVPVARYGWSIWEAIPMVFIVAIVLALLFGIPTLRLRADYLAIVTIAASEIVRISLNSVRFTWLTGGNDGLQNFTGDLRSVNPIGAHRYLPSDRHPGFGEYDLFIIVIGGRWSSWPVAVYLLCAARGVGAQEHPEDEGAARSSGKNVFAYKLQSLAIGLIGARRQVIAIGGQVGTERLQHRHHVLCLDGHDPRRRREGEGTDHRRRDVLVHPRIRRELPRPGHPRGTAAALARHQQQLRPVAVHAHRRGPSPSRHIPPARCFRRQTGAGLRCPLTRPARLASSRPPSA
jgi:branched-chain amino acid transport system permease protein